jgi:hypothetical protein
MSLNPLKSRLDANLFPLLNLAYNRLNKVLILDRLLKRSLPVVETPVYVPLGDTVNGIAAIGEYADFAVERGDFDGAEDGGQFSTLVSLAGAGEGFGDVSGEREGSVSRTPLQLST